MPAPAPGGGLVRHPCARGCKVAHEFGFECEAVVEYDTCGTAPGYVGLKPLPQDPELDPEDGEDRLACVTVGGGSVAYEGRPGYVELKPLPQDPELDPEDGEDRLACVTVGGGSVAYEGFCDLSSPLSDVDALAAKRVDAKTKHFQLEDGWVALDVPRNYSEAMRHRRAPQLWQVFDH